MLFLHRSPFRGIRLLRYMHTITHTPEVIQKQRRELLLKIYAPFQALTKDSPEYNSLARSGRVWGDYFQPGDYKKKGYLCLQEEFSDVLGEIDSCREAINLPAEVVAKYFVSDYAHQSVEIEDNHLHLGQSHEIFNALQSTMFSRMDMPSLSAEELAQSSIPDVRSVLPNADADQVNELRNHIIASYWVAEVASRKPGTSGLQEDEVRSVQKLLLKDTQSERMMEHPAFGPKVSPGAYRPLPIRVRSNPMRVFPYHDEVPALMQRFYQWRDRVHAAKKLHPLVTAIHMIVHFVHIHPFSDGNGRLSRILMQDYMCRHRYLAVALPGIDRQDYLRMISDASDGMPDELVAKVLTTQLEYMHTVLDRYVKLMSENKSL